jgi:hypothetical protein
MESTTRWNSFLKMINSLIKAKFAIRQTFLDWDKEKPNMSKEDLSTSQWSKLEEFAAFLLPFAEMTEELQHAKKPTLSHIRHFVETTWKVTKANMADDPLIRTSKQIIRSNYEKQFLEYTNEGLSSALG